MGEKIDLFRVSGLFWHGDGVYTWDRVELEIWESFWSALMLYERYE
jgi:hypothetical protein